MRPAALLALVGAVLVAGCDVDGGGSSDELELGPPRDVPFGFNDDAVAQGLVTPDQDARLARRAGAEVNRMTIDWRSVEPQPGVYRFELYDRLYAALLRHGIRPLWVVAFAPPWARDPRPCPGDCRAPPAAHAEDDWARFVAEVARRYPRSFGVEVWNEPNFANFFAPRPDPARYTRLLHKAYRAVKRVRPRLPVAGGALATFLEEDAGMVPLESFLSGMYAAGAGDHMDAVSLHPYPGDPEESLVEEGVAAALRARDEAKPLWITETGARTAAPDPDLRWSPKEQAEELVAIYDLLSRVPDVDVVIVHTLVEPPGGLGFAVLTPGLTPKPAYCALVRRLGPGGAKC